MAAAGQGEMKSLLGGEKQMGLEAASKRLSEARRWMRGLNPDSLTVSLGIAIVIGVICGISAWAYYTVLEFFLDIFWEKLPEFVVASNPLWPQALYWLWIPIVCLSFSFLVGYSIDRLGFPGDLGYTVKCVNQEGFIDMGHTPSMVVASQFSILAGASLGPEAPLVAICAAIAGSISKFVFGNLPENVVRKHTLCGMACALAAFFGVPLGGSIFALEINHRLGYEYFEHAMTAVASGTTCLIVFRGIAGLPIGPIWHIGTDALGPSSADLVVLGLTLGLLGAGIAFVFSIMHNRIGKFISDHNMEDANIKRAMIGGGVIAFLGILIPQTMFWGEFEFQTFASLGETALPHVWPATGLTNYQLNGAFALFLAACAKMVAITFTVWGGFRGGYIFPFFCAGAAFGRAVTYIFPWIPAPVACLCIAAGINVAITRTAFATTIILVALSGQINAASPVLAAALASIFVTYSMPFIRSQQSRYLWAGDVPEDKSTKPIPIEKANAKETYTEILGSSVDIESSQEYLLSHESSKITTSNEEYQELSE